MDARTAPAGPLPGPAVLVDAANVVGARPDGWWRDRAGAAARLVGRLQLLDGAALPDSGPYAGEPLGAVVIVLEGAARPGVGQGLVGTVDVRHAPGSGDDALVTLAAPRTVLVTADRELARRARERGAHVAGPRWLLDWLDGLSG